MAMIMPCAPLAAGGKTGAKTCTVGSCTLLTAGRKNRRKNAHRLLTCVLASPLAGKPAGRAEPSAFPTNAPYMWKKEQSRDKERRRAREKGTGLVRKKRRSKEPRRYQPGLSSVLFVHGSSPGVQYSHSGEPLNNSIFDDTAINGSFFFEANYVHCMGISCFRSFLLRNRCRND